MASTLEIQHRYTSSGMQDLTVSSNPQQNKFDWQRPSTKPTESRISRPNEWIENGLAKEANSPDRALYGATLMGFEPAQLLAQKSSPKEHQTPPHNTTVPCWLAGWTHYSDTIEYQMKTLSIAVAIRGVLGIVLKSVHFLQAICGVMFNLSGKIPYFQFLVHRLPFQRNWWVFF